LLSKTHKVIAGYIFREALSQKNVLLNKTALMYGSVKPDFIPKYKLKKHYMDESFDFAVNKIVETISLPKISRKRLSTNIGVISHYLSDFFCLPHSECWYFFKDRNTVRHMRYERRLQEAVSVYSGSIDSCYPQPIHNNREYIKNYIYDCYSDYRQKEGYEHDFEHAVMICLSISLFILNNVIVQL